MNHIRDTETGVLWRFNSGDFQKLLGKQMFAKYSIQVVFDNARHVVSLRFNPNSGFFYADLGNRFRLCGLEGLIAAQDTAGGMCSISTDVIVPPGREVYLDV